MAVSNNSEQPSSDGNKQLNRYRKGGIHMYCLDGLTSQIAISPLQIFLEHAVFAYRQ